MAHTFTHISLTGVGPFGRRVTALLDQRWERARTEPGDRPAADAFGGPDHLVVLAQWRPDHGLSEDVDARAHATGTPWLPVTADHPMVLVGPLVLPGTGPCFRCFLDRKAQHDAHTDHTVDTLAAYGRDPGLGAAGYLPQHARTAAGLAARALAAPQRAVGRVATLPLGELDIRRDAVTGRHGCDRCGAAYGPPEVRRLRRELLAAVGKEWAGVG